MPVYKTWNPPRKKTQHKKTHDSFRGGQKNPRVSVLIAAYKAEQWIEACIKNVLAQPLPPGWEMEIIVGVDGCASTFEAANRIKDPRLGILFFSENRGTYITFNSLVPHATGELMLRHDADDLMGKTRLIKMIKCFINDPSVDMVGTSYQLMSADMSKVIKPNLYPGEGTWMWKRSTWDKKLGGFEPWRCAADSEILARAQLGFKLRSVILQDPSLLLYRQHANSLYQNSETGLGSLYRQKRAEIIKKRSNQFRLGEKPRKLKPKTHKANRQAGRLFRDTVTVSLASIPVREKTLRRTVSSLLRQVDQLNVYLNNYETVPFYLKHPKITVARSQDHGDIGDRGKFWWAANVWGYHLTCDDDIIYPQNYVQTMIAAIERYKRKAIVSCHGTLISPTFESWYGPGEGKAGIFPGRRATFSFLRENQSDKQVHIGGTGVAGYHSDGCRLIFDDFAESNSADIFVAQHSQHFHTPIICIAHKADWLKSVDYQDSIWRHSVENSPTAMNKLDLTCKIIISLQPWQLFL